MRLLLVEDNERFAALLSQGLAGAGFAVDVLPTAGDATSALDGSRWDVVVLDRGLPDSDGLEVLTGMFKTGAQAQSAHVAAVQDILNAYMKGATGKAS